MLRKMIDLFRNKKRRILYILCFALFCLIDQRSKTAGVLEGWRETFANLTGVGMAVIIMSHYRWTDIKRFKVPYIVWTLLWILSVVPVYLWGKANYPFLNAWCVLLADVILYGYILIYTFITVVVEKRLPKLNKPFAITWLIMMVLMIVSRSDYLWPFANLVMFGCFYLTDYTGEEQEDLFQGMLEGIILAFLLMQGWCFVFRPYDAVRYVGVYTNSNNNALFYLEVLAAVFAKILYVARIQANKWIKIYYWLGAGVLLSFIFLTIGRIAWITALVIGLVSLGALKLLQKKRNFVKNGLVLVLCTCLTFPLVFGAVRYLPPLFHHPVWHWGEWANEKVHSWDPWNSEKYIDLDEFLEAAVGRITDSVEDLLAESPLLLRVEAAENLEPEVDPRVEAAVMTEEEANNGYLVRTTIYKHYLKNLNIWGHPYEEQGFQLHPTYWIGHAHNIYLQYGTDFGIPMMIVFIIIILWSIILFVKRMRRDCTEKNLGCLLFLMVPALFGIFEYSWGVGSISILLLFMVWRPVFCSEEYEKV